MRILAGLPVSVVLAGMLAACKTTSGVPEATDAPPATTLVPALPPESGSAIEHALQVGKIAPAFTAVDQAGRERDLASLCGPRGLVLLFVRSADW